DPDMARPEAIVALPPGSTLLLYTDGLIERRGHRLEEGLDALAAQASACNGLPVEEMCDELLRVLVPELPGDDIALVAIRLVSADARAFTYRVPAAADELVVMRRRLRDWLVRRHFPTRVSDDVVLAVGEACTNAVEHAYASDGPNSVVVEAHRVDDDIVLTVRDYGSWRRLAPDPRRNRGLRLMAAVMDDVSVSAAPDGGTRVRMRRHLGVS
ncbi:MAG: ATP-binding protein, partial [Actinomycetota bacterium]|nr:ATP-binding protein [Actinomycetota bacterium]